MSRRALQIIAAVMFAAGLCLAARAQSNFQTAACDDRDGSTRHSSSDQRFTHCEMRTTKLAANGKQLAVDTVNGGISVVGEDRSDIQLEARIESWADSQSEADKRGQETTIQTADNHVHADTPRDWRGQNNEAVSFRLRVPRQYSVKLDDVNGGITVANLDGTINLRTENGSISLRDVAGDVQSHTTNGSINIEVAGENWRGTGVVAETTNGSASITLPQNYSAHLEAGVVNGKIHFDFPLTMSHFDSRQISTDIGKGGAPIRLHTVNGSVNIRRNSVV